MFSDPIELVVIRDALGDVTVSLIHLVLSDGTEYHEVGIHDTRPLDLRKHKWVVVDSYLDSEAGSDVFAETVGTVRAGHRVVPSLVFAA